MDELELTSPEPVKKKAKTKPRKKVSKEQSIDGLKHTLQSLHSILAVFTKTPELILNDGQSNALAIGISDVAEMYDFGLSDEQLAWVQLATIAAGVYGPKFAAAKVRLAKEAEEAKEKENDQSS